MAFDGNGNWVSNYSAVADRDADIKILASRFDGIFIADIAQSFENCLTKDAQVKPQQAFDANSYKVINVDDPTNPHDAVNLETITSGLTSIKSSSPSLSDDSQSVLTTDWFNDKVKIVSTLPATPDADVFYFITG